MKRKYDLSQWQELLEDYNLRTVTSKAWCEKKGVCIQTLSYWRKKINDSSDKQADGSEQKWASISIAQSQSLMVLKVGAFSFEIAPGFDRHTFAEVLGIVTKLC